MSPRPIVWVVSYTQYQSDEISGLLKNQFQAHHPIAQIVSTGLKQMGLAYHPQGALKDDPLLSTVVLVLERAGLLDECYVEFLRWCISRVASSDDFRLIVYMLDIHLEDLMMTGASEDDDVLFQLVDTVQLSESQDIHQICQQVLAHIQNLDNIRKEASWIRFRLSALSISGQIATAIQVACIFPALFLAFWLPVWNVNASLGTYAYLENYIFVICGIAGVPFLILLMYVYTRYGIFLLRMREDEWGILYGALASFITPLTLLIPFRLHAPIMWILLSISLGFILDAVRRSGYIAQREKQPINPSTITERHGRLPKNLKKQAGPGWINPLRCPLMPVRDPRVFVSYTRGSSWAKQVLEELRHRLYSVGVKVFTDAEIPPGSNWRRELNHQISNCTVFVSIAELISVEREWPAAEAEAALKGRDLTGLPEIIVIKSPNLQQGIEDRWRWLPVFKAILHPNGSEFEDGNGLEDKPHIFSYNETTAQAIAHKLHSRAYRTVSVIPSSWAEVLYRLWYLPAIILITIGSAGAFAGFSAVFILFLDKILGMNVSGWLLENGLLNLFFILCAIWIGFTARMTLETWFHSRNPNAVTLAAGHLIATGSLVALQLAWIWYVDPLFIGGAIVISIFSFIAADQMCALKNRSFSRA